MTVVIGSLWIGIGASWLWLAWRGSQRQLKYGSIWGIRAAWARTSPEAWTEAHQELAGAVGVGGAISILGGLVILAGGIDPPIGTIGLLVAVLGSVGGQLVGTRRARAAVARLDG